MGMKNVYMSLAIMMAAVASGKDVYMGEPRSSANYYEPSKITGFTAAQGRKKLSKKKRKELNAKKHKKDGSK